MEVDVAIIGAGPAGSTLAALLAGRGCDVALIDKDRFPRDKLCGEFLSYDALPVLELLGLDIDRERPPSIAVCRVVGNRRTYEFRFPRTARGISRLLFDELLLRHAEGAGARRLDGLTASAIDRESVTIDGGERIDAKVIVGAWGRWGRFDRYLNRPFVADRVHRHFGFKRHYRADQPREAAIDLYSYDQGYLGVNSVEGGRTNICGLVHAERIAGMKGGWDGFVSTLRSESPALDALFGSHQPAQDEFLSCEPVIFRPRAPVEREIVMIGDAAGLIDPLTGNGMAMAVQSALVAAPFILKALRGESLAPYAAAHRAFFERRIGWSRRIAFLLSRPRLLEWAMALSSSPSPGRFLLAKTRALPDSLDSAIRDWKRA